jgi:hypothetical protein
MKGDSSLVKPFLYRSPSLGSRLSVCSLQEVDIDAQEKDPGRSSGSFAIASEIGTD